MRWEWAKRVRIYTNTSVAEKRVVLTRWGDFEVDHHAIFITWGEDADGHDVTMSSGLYPTWVRVTGGGGGGGCSRRAERGRCEA
jgi:hypothetical protein